MHLRQNELEEMFSKTNRHQLILDELQSEDWFNEEVTKGIELIQDWLGDEYYESKQIRLAKLAKVKSLKSLVEYYFTASTMFYQNMPLVSAGSMLAHKLEPYFESKVDAIKTTVEIIAVLIPCNIYQLYRNDTQQYCISSCIELEQDTLDKLNKLMYLPPLVEPAKPLTRNTSSGYHTIKRDSLILGNPKNYHDGNIGLDVLNILNKNKYKIDFDFISQVKEEPSEKTEQALWEQYIEQRDYTYSLLSDYEVISLTHKSDKRGRIYSQGYHVNPQGDSFHKAMITLATEEIVPLD